MYKIKVKKNHPDAVLPKKAHATDTGWDLFALEDTCLVAGKFNFVKTGLTLEVPDGYYYEIHPRSSIKLKNLGELPAIIDNGYRGPCDVLLRNRTDVPYTVLRGDKVGQIIIREQVDIGWKLEVVDELSETTRGAGGFGSTGR